ncbi:MAG: hypothetical protein IJQ36_02420 [Oscillospiraceae bacterium]|nr:hypothetical protein [Oscillospiraceae bacterium]
MKRFSLTLAAFFLVLLLSFTLAAGVCAEGSAPAAENLELVTKRSTPVEGLLAARNAAGELCSFTITTRPVKGDIELQADGRFLYTPRPNKTGRDYFGYRAVDAAGNVSEEATVLIRIKK